MRLSVKSSTVISLVIFTASILAWVVILFNPGHIMTMEHCHVSDAGPSATSLKMLLQMNPVSSQLAGWLLMVAAMMLPKLIVPILHIWRHSLRRRRLSLSLLFVLGYTGVWMVAGIAMIAAIIALHLLMPGSYLPAIALSIIAIIWQCSPVKQLCLNRGHDHRTLAAFGWPAARDALQFGVMHGVWCAGSGWAIMLLPMLLPSGHNFAMILVTFIMLSEHFEHPKMPRWRIDLRGKLFRLIAAQAQIKFRQAYSPGRIS